MSTKYMYAVAGDGPSNEDLALQIQEGDRHAADLLISQNEGYLTKLALEYAQWSELEDLKQEGAMALLETAKRFDPSYGTKLLTYANASYWLGHDRLLLPQLSFVVYSVWPIPSAS